MYVRWEWVRTEEAAVELMKKITKESSVRHSGDFMYCGDIKAMRKYKYEENYGYREWWLLWMPSSKDTGWVESNFQDKAMEEFKSCK